MTGFRDDLPPSRHARRRASTAVSCNQERLEWQARAGHDERGVRPHQPTFGSAVQDARTAIVNERQSVSRHGHSTPRDARRCPRPSAPTGAPPPARWTLRSDVTRAALRPSGSRCASDPVSPLRDVAQTPSSQRWHACWRRGWPSCARSACEPSRSCAHPPWSCAQPCHAPLSCGWQSCASWSCGPSTSPSSCGPRLRERSSPASRVCALQRHARPASLSQPAALELPCVRRSWRCSVQAFSSPEPYRFRVWSLWPSDDPSTASPLAGRAACRCWCRSLVETPSRVFDRGRAV